MDGLPYHGAPEGNDNAAKERKNKPDNVSFEYGTSHTYTLKRLKRDAPVLFQKVVDGEMSAKAAAL